MCWSGPDWAIWGGAFTTGETIKPGELPEASALPPCSKALLGAEKMDELCQVLVQAVHGEQQVTQLSSEQAAHLEACLLHSAAGLLEATTLTSSPETLRDAPSPPEASPALATRSRQHQLQQAFQTRGPLSKGSPAGSPDEEHQEPSRGPLVAPFCSEPS